MSTQANNTTPITPPFAVPVSARYGAPMGRTESRPPKAATIKAYLKRVPITQGYDPGGAYWGTGEPLYCAYAVQWNQDTEQDDELTLYVRAIDRQAAKNKLLADYPNLKFYR